jgi:hypothetical protein
MAAIWRTAAAWETELPTLAAVAVSETDFSRAAMVWRMTAVCKIEITREMARVWRIAADWKI